MVNFEQVPHTFFSVSIVDFEQVNVSWVILSIQKCLKTAEA